MLTQSLRILAGIARTTRVATSKTATKAISARSFNAKVIYHCATAK